MPQQRVVILSAGSFIIAVDYFQERYPGTTVIFDMSVVYISVAFIAVFANNILVETFSLNTRITFGKTRADDELPGERALGNGSVIIRALIFRIPRVLRYPELRGDLRDLVGAVRRRDFLQDELSRCRDSVARLHR